MVDSAASAVDLVADQPLGEGWSHLDKRMVAQLIQTQNPSFRSVRPLIWDGSDLLKQIALGLETTLKHDFCWSLTFSPLFMAQLVYEGFLPICAELGGGTGLWLLMPKWHVQRCTMRFSDAHVSKSAKKRARRFRLTVDQEFDQVVDRCVEQHGENWLYPPMRKAFCALHHWGAARGGIASTAGASTDEDTGDDVLGAVQFHSFELWQGSELVAGEFGATVGAVYTSFTGFYSVSGAGTVQLLAMASLLSDCGYDFWDLGQELKYKLDLGARLLPRVEFLAAFREARVRTPRELNTVPLPDSVSL